MTRPLAALAAAALLAAPGPAPAGGPSCDGSSCAFPRPARLVALGARDCAACRRMAPVLDDAERRCGAVERLGVEDAQGAALAAQHLVTRLPTVLVLDGAGRELRRLEGEQPLQALEGAAREAGRRCGAGPS